MKGTHSFSVYNKKIRYDVELKRNITLIAGDSGTGKTSMVNLLRRYRHQSTPIIRLVSDVPVYAVSEEWDEAEKMMTTTHDSIIIIDETAAYLKTEIFASLVKQSSNYFLIISRSSLYMLPYSVQEVYQMVGGKNDQQQYFHTLQQLYEVKPIGSRFIPDAIIVEDSNSGYEFFKSTARSEIQVLSAGGRDNVINTITTFEKNKRLVIIVDGAACGAAFGDIISSLDACYKLSIIWCYESFEWLLLSADLFRNSQIEEILKNTSDYVESEAFFSWERYFTDLLSKISVGTGLDYRKSSLNKKYLEEGIKQKIIKKFPDKLDVV